MAAIETIRIKDIQTTATTAAADDYIVIDGATNKVRKGLASNLITATAAAAVAGHDASVDVHRTGRPRLGVFGNSIAAQCGRALNVYTTSVSAEVKAGSVVIPVASAAAFSAGDKFAVRDLSNKVLELVVGSVDGNNITITAPTTSLIRSGETVSRYTDAHPRYDQGLGVAYAANSLLGFRFDLAGVWGYGGALSAAILPFLSSYIESARPTHLVLHLFENDCTTTVPLVDMELTARNACRECITRGVIPILCSPMPHYQLPAAQAGKYDAMLAYCLAIGAVVPGAIGVDCSTKWLDTSSQTYPRSPITGWTDGVHPALGYRYECARLTVLPVLAQVVEHSTPADEFVTPFSATSAMGTGGTISGFTGGSVAPAGYTVTANGGKVTATSSRSTEGELRLSLDWSGKSVAALADSVTAAYSWTLPTSIPGSSLALRALANFRIVGIASVSQVTISVTPNNGPAYWYSAGTLAEADVSTGLFSIHTDTFKIPTGATSVAISVGILPKAEAVSTASMVVDVLSLGLIIDRA